MKVKAGKFDCLVAEPFLRTPALFKQKGRIVVFLSDDQYKIPVLMVPRIFTCQQAPEARGVAGGERTGAVLRPAAEKRIVRSQ
ncbi:MAG: hypothetical protein Q9P14_05655 [candidate division KSB1 bacterium]|nr:hypothetical protein [candidate division KSB1 bacterium]